VPNNYYERQSEMNPGELADGLAMEQEFDAIGRGFSKLPEPHRDGHGFEGPTRVGDPVEETDAVNLGSLKKLNIPIYRKKITTDDWNSLVEPGIYDVVNASGANKPPVHPYGILTVYKFNGVVTQEYVPDRLGVLVKRTIENILNNQWGEWDAAISSSNSQIGFRNKIINAAFLINQRNYASGGATSAGQYTLDRWKVSAAGGITFSLSSGVVVVTITQGQTLKQVIEGTSIQSGKHTLSWGGTALGRIDDGQFGASGEVRADLVGGNNVTVEFSAGTLFNAQLEPGILATKFELRHLGDELQLCQRYYESGYFYSTGYVGVGPGQVVSSIQFKAVKRVTPTVSMSGLSFANCNSASPQGAKPSSVWVQVNGLATTAAYVHGNYEASAEL